MSSDVFPGPFAPMPDAVSAAILWGMPPSNAPVPVRFVAGFEPFAAFVLSQGAHPALLADDLAATWDFVAAHPAILDRADLAAAAARFVGNVVAVVHPSATWRMTTEPEIGTNAISIPVVGLVQGMVRQPDQREAFLQMLASWDQEDRDDQEMRALSEGASVPTLVVPANAYIRPALPRQLFRDDHGEVIRYGHRWPDGTPPDEAYSRESHPERFVPLRLVVDALVDHLRTEYEVEVRRVGAGGDAARVVLEPAAGAGIVITMTSPVVRVDAGALFHAFVPSCTCDACDENAETAADELERIVLAVACGGLAEKYPVGRRAWLYTDVRSPGGERRESAAGPAPEMSEQESQRATSLLRGLDDGWWPAWPLRSSPA